MSAADLGAAPDFRTIRLQRAKVHRQTAIGTGLLLHLQKHGAAIHEIEITLGRIVGAGAVSFAALIRLDRDSGMLANLRQVHEGVVTRAQGFDGRAGGDEHNFSGWREYVPDTKSQRNGGILTLASQGIKLSRTNGWALRGLTAGIFS
jgi:hypothetical protein